MLKYLLSVLLLSFSLLFGASPSGDIKPPYRPDLGTSKSTEVVKHRADRILATLVSDPENYNVMISNEHVFGGEAIGPGVFSEKPTMIVYQGALSPNRSDEEIAFMMAHELGHLKLQHNEKMSYQMDKIFKGPPAALSGCHFDIFYQKLQERQADLYGLSLYHSAGYSMDFFAKTLALMQKNVNLHTGMTKPFSKERSSLSMHDSHFSMVERFTLLTHEADKLVNT